MGRKRDIGDIENYEVDGDKVARQNKKLRAVVGILTGILCGLLATWILFILGVI